MEKNTPKNMLNYDSKADIVEHIDEVLKLLFMVAEELIKRGIDHDLSKLSKEEKPYYDESTPKLRKLTYGSKEYQESLDKLKPALKHHYEDNRHHPEHFENGIDGMNLVDIMEMLCDWKAATLRHENGDIYKSLEINTKRFNISPQLLNILKNTVDEFF